MNNMEEQYIYFFIGMCVFLFIFVSFYSYQSHPSLIGLTIQAAEKKLEASGKKLKLGSKIGFIQPKKNQFYLLGKISEQTYVPPSGENEYGLIHYKLYQLDMPALPPAPPLIIKTQYEYIPEYIPPTPPPSPPKIAPPSPKKQSPPRKPKLFHIPQRKNTTKQYASRESFFW